MVTAVEKVRDRLRRVTGALEQAHISYAVVGGNAVAAWVGEVDEAAVRNTQKVDILLRRADLEQAKTALAAVGFVYRHSSGIDMFLDGPTAKDRDAVHIHLVGEKLRPTDLAAAPDVTESKAFGPFCVLNLEPLVRMKLAANRLDDRVDVQDLIDIGLVDASWPSRFPPELGQRLQGILDTPEG
ncbi:MAG: hypothetical protein K8T91_20525 [Planctomycetes bacterium]|nr:hypothetical protein [Planctomycetota bacterium]